MERWDLGSLRSDQRVGDEPDGIGLSRWTPSPMLRCQILVKFMVDRLLTASMAFALPPWTLMGKSLQYKAVSVPQRLCTESWDGFLKGPMSFQRICQLCDRFFSQRFLYLEDEVTIFAVSLGWLLEVLSVVLGISDGHLCWNGLFPKSLPKQFRRLISR